MHQRALLVKNNWAQREYGSPANVEMPFYFLCRRGTPAILPIVVFCIGDIRSNTVAHTIAYG